MALIWCPNFDLRIDVPPHPPHLEIIDSPAKADVFRLRRTVAEHGPRIEAIRTAIVWCKNARRRERPA